MTTRLLALLVGAGLGAGSMYLLDPQAGRRRRTFVRKTIERARHLVRGANQPIGRDVRWSPTARTLASLVASGMLATGTGRGTSRALVRTLSFALLLRTITNGHGVPLAASSGGRAPVG